MKKLMKSFVCMAIVLIALSVICEAFNGFKPCGELHYEAQLSGLLNWLPVFAVIGFFTGFMPAYIHESIKAMRPAPAAQMEAKAQVNASPAEQEQEAPAQAAAPALYVGQVIAANGGYFRVKALKMAA